MITASSSTANQAAKHHLAMLVSGSLSPATQAATQHLAQALVQIRPDVQWSLTVWGSDPSGLGWPRGLYRNLPDRADPASLNPLRPLFQASNSPIDVLYLPSLTTISLVGVVDPLPASLVINVSELDIPADFAAAQRFRQRAQKLLSLASLVIVPSAALGDQLRSEFDLPVERLHVIPPSNTFRNAIVVALEYVECFNRVNDKRYQMRPRMRTKPMVTREERVLYLLNHTTLKASELPVIRALELEVYASKLISGQSSFRSGSVDYADNDSSTLPRWVLAELDRHNFYDDAMTPAFAKLINDHFGVVICTALNNLVDQLMKYFEGRIVIRAFGREAPLTYAQVFAPEQSDFWEVLWRNQHRFWMGVGYESITPHEPALLRQNSTFLPLSMPDSIYSETNTWVGTDPRVYFICPDIFSPGDYYGNIYRDFKANFGHLPHLIGGRQVIPVDDPNVIGFVSDERMKQYFREMRVMFYHSREPRHIHYHPLEAIVYGMPLIYMNGGLLEYFAHGRKMPGACDTYAEANAKLQRILAGDEAFTRSVIESQPILIEEFAPDFVLEEWRKQFTGEVMRRPLIPDVVPFGAWQTPITISPSSAPTDLPLSNSRHVLFYGKMNTGDAVYHTTTTWLREVLNQTGAADWQIDIQWGSPIQNDAAPTWQEMLPDRLQVYDLDDTEHSNPQPTLVKASAAVAPNNPPPSPPLPPLPERVSPPYLTLDEIYQMVETYDVVCFPQPLGLLSPNLPLEGLTPLPIVVYIPDLAHEYGDNITGLAIADAYSREIVVWSHLAQLMIFPSELIRNQAIERYAIPAERTRVIPLSYIAPSSTARSSPAIELELPDSYLLATVDDLARDNLDSLLEALRILRWHGEKLPPLVLLGTGIQSALLTDQPTNSYHRLLQQIIRDGQFAIGKDIILIEPHDVVNLVELCRHARLCLSISRIGSDAYGLIGAALWAKSPLIIGKTPHSQQFASIALLEPPDDPVALSDAILRVIDNYDEAITRANAGAAWVAQRTQQMPSLAQELEQVAAQRAPSLTRPLVSSQKKVTVTMPSSTTRSTPKLPSSTVPATLASKPSSRRAWLVRLNTFVVHSVLPVFKLTSLKRYRQIEQEMKRQRIDYDALTIEVLRLRSQTTAKPAVTSSAPVNMLDELKQLSQRLERVEAQYTEKVSSLPLFNYAKLNPTENVVKAIAAVRSEGNSTVSSDVFYTALETAFRGDDALITQRQQRYLPWLPTDKATEQAPILDIGCGRGEFLRLLREVGVPCVGVDPNSAHIEQLKEQGFNVYQQDGVEYLGTRTAASLSAIVSFQVIEHVDLAYLERWLQLAMTTLVDGGQILLETVNPYCLATYRTFYIDPTHTRPLPVDLLAMMMWTVGFTDLQVFYQNPVLTYQSISADNEVNTYETYALLAKRPAR